MRDSGQAGTLRKSSTEFRLIVGVFSGASYSVGHAPITVGCASAMAAGFSDRANRARVDRDIDQDDERGDDEHRGLDLADSRGDRSASSTSTGEHRQAQSVRVTNRTCTRWAAGGPTVVTTVNRRIVKTMAGSARGDDRCPWRALVAMEGPPQHFEHGDVAVAYYRRGGSQRIDEG